MTHKPLSSRELDRQILALALPSLATLLVEPLLIAVDSTMVGRLGTAQLAGLSLAFTVLGTLVGICIFLSYATTAATARLVGAGKPAAGLRQGIDGMWLALALGAGLGVALFALAPGLIGLFNPAPDVAGQAVAYTRASAPGLPGMLLVLAANGTLRGFADAKTPLKAATAGALANIPLNAALIYGADWGVAGAGAGSAIAQTAMGAYLTWAVVKLARTHQAALTPSGGGVLRSLRDAGPLVIRTLCLRAALILQISAATSLGTVQLAANQIVMTMWNFASFGMDSLATAAQILTGQGLGRGDTRDVHRILRRCEAWGVRAGIAVGAAYVALAFVVPWIMTADGAVQAVARNAMWVTAAAMPVAAVAYILDGVLIGAGDTRALARYMVFALAAFAPIAAAFLFWDAGTLGMLLLWGGYALVFMGARAATMLWRVRGEAWMGL
ncbi:MATE family efflux transporter [Arcanobacterium wilhelmae]|uniref:MATE family efflux transporter n=1 Tax=Arcanobacterium wilhelmae TaxID=1803177 RepID=UPI0024152700|nr:MATE family efflux transporter [Arcanobacterium wilhelmae]WFN90240.1 MATE family efflux transporter [Arcanobacterium wilhelmae]